MVTLLCIDPAIWVPSVAAIIAAGITACVSFIILRKQINNNSLEAKKDRNSIIATNKYQCKLQQLSQLESAGLELIDAINPHKLYDLEMIASLGDQHVITYINEFGDTLDNSSNRYLSRVKLISHDSGKLCDSIKGAVDRYHQMIRDIQEIARKNLQAYSSSFVDTKLLQFAKKHNGDIVATIAEYSKEKDTFVNTIYTNLSDSIQKHYIKNYEEALESFERAINS